MLDGQEGKPYENLLSLRGDKIVFDAPDRFHYLATRGQAICGAGAAQVNKVHL